MALHKIVNGIRIELTEEEETATIAEWEANRLRVEAKRAELAKKEAVKKEAQEKLCALAGLTEEERLLLFQ